jgi:hypothetical protein
LEKVLKGVKKEPLLIGSASIEEGQMAQTVKLSDELVEDAKRIAAIEHRSVPRQIEFYFRMALIAEENPDLSFKLIREILKADAEDATEEYVFG